jgi:predicted ester cyclase
MLNRLLADTDLVDPNPDLLQPRTLLVDPELTEVAARHRVRIAQLLYTFWNTGDPNFLRHAVEETSKNKTLPLGRSWDLDAPIAASLETRAAVPDLTCEIVDLLVTGHKLNTLLEIRGHFTGTFNGIRGSGQEIDFTTCDVQHLHRCRIGEDGHIADYHAIHTTTGLPTVAGARRSFRHSGCTQSAGPVLGAAHMQHQTNRGRAR